MSDLIQKVTDGVIEQAKTASKENKAGNELGKDAFLQLLVTQMKYQDPLNPNTDTEYIAQLATFSQLEQLQNLSTVTSNTQAFSLVGKNVIVKAESAAGGTKYITGKVDFINMSGGKAKLSINGSLYSIDQLDSVIDDVYIIEKGLPGIKEKINLEYDGSNPSDISFDVHLGEGDTIADDVAIFIGNDRIGAEHVSLDKNKVTIAKEALQGYQDGTYKVTVAFNDALLTTVKDMVSLRIVNSQVNEEAPDEATPDEKSDDNAKDETGI